MSEVLQVSKAGTSVLGTALTNDDYIYNSQYNTLKYYAQGSAVLTANGLGTGTLVTVEGTVAHNLGFVPYFTVYVNDFADGTVSYALVPYKSNTASITREGRAYADSTNLYVRLLNKSASNYTAVFYYKIFRNNLGL